MTFSRLKTGLELFIERLTNILFRYFEMLEREDIIDQADIRKTLDSEALEFRNYVPESLEKSGSVYLPDDRFVKVFDDSMILGSRGLCLDSKNRIIAEVSGDPQLTPRRQKMCLKRAFKDLRLSFNRREPVIQLRDACPLLPFYVNYFHWTAESLMKVFMLEKYGELEESYPTLVIPQDPTSWMEETLDLVDYSGKIVQLPRPQIVGVDRLVIPSYPAPTKEACSWLRDRMLSNIEPDLEPGKKRRLLVKRQDADERRLINHKEVENELTDLGFEAIVPGKYSVAEQVKIFSQAEIIVGAHGAGLTNIIYSEDAQVVELYGVIDSTIFSRIGNMLGHDYLKIECKTQGRDLIADPERIKNKLQIS